MTKNQQLHFEGLNQNELLSEFYVIIYKHRQCDYYTESQSYEQIFVFNKKKMNWISLTVYFFTL